LIVAIVLMRSIHVLVKPKSKPPTTQRTRISRAMIKDTGLPAVRQDYLRNRLNNLFMKIPPRLSDYILGDIFSRVIFLKGPLRSTILGQILGRRPRVVSEAV
jgi:hypothetical protein